MDIDHRLGHITNVTQEDSLSRGDGCIRVLSFEEGDCECACDLSSHEGHAIFPKLIDMKVF